MPAVITRREFDGREAEVWRGPVREGAGYFCAIVAPEVKRHAVEQTLTGRLGGGRSFTASGPERSMISIRWR